MFKGESRLFICWLMMKLAIVSNKELMCMLMHIIRVGFEKLNPPRMAYIISCYWYFLGFRLDTFGDLTMIDPRRCP